MLEFDDFISQLLEESRICYEKAKSVEDGFSQDTFIHSSLLLSISTLESCINAISEELLIEPYKNEYSVHEQALLLEKDVKFDKGEYRLGNGLKISKTSDRIEYLYYKFSGKKLGSTDLWYCNLKQSIDVRNKLVHPKEYVKITLKQAETALLSVIEAMNVLYLLIYKKKLPTYDRGLSSKKDLVIN